MIDFKGLNEFVSEIAIRFGGVDSRLLSEAGQSLSDSHGYKLLYFATQYEMRFEDGRGVTIWDASTSDRFNEYIETIKSCEGPSFVDPPFLLIGWAEPDRIDIVDDPTEAFAMVVPAWDCTTEVGSFHITSPYVVSSLQVVNTETNLLGLVGVISPQHASTLAFMNACDVVLWRDLANHRGPLIAGMVQDVRDFITMLRNDMDPSVFAVIRAEMEQRPNLHDFATLFDNPNGAID